MAGLVFAGVLIGSFLRSGGDDSFLCSLASKKLIRATSDYPTTPAQLQAIVHYATSRITPQQNIDEITVTLDVLRGRSFSPANFLVFGLGFDSLMWSALNPRGKTVFLESYRKEPTCSPARAYLDGNYACPLALTGLPGEVYATEWDLIMIDAPRGYFAEAPGRMGAIFSAAVMARARKGSGVTHVFLHDVDRKVEKAFAEEFLCRKYLVKGVGRLWHFEIPPASNVTGGQDENSWFC
ncbi:unnamed protein product [Linum tenue]|uniref:Polysaccharide biosynthesis domain-containing protein n=1 Tax=Linum tenue TaxID=586396 RepID=A0AAV0S393_9ROSI|nr:unnamed protein product [Linum tenue]